MDYFLYLLNLILGVLIWNIKNIKIYLPPLIAISLILMSVDVHQKRELLKQNKTQKFFIVSNEHWLFYRTSLYQWFCTIPTSSQSAPSHPFNKSNMINTLQQCKCFVICCNMSCNPKDAGNHLGTVLCLKIFTCSSGAAEQAADSPVQPQGTLTV